MKQNRSSSTLLEICVEEAYIGRGEGKKWWRKILWCDIVPWETIIAWFDQDCNTIKQEGKPSHFPNLRWSWGTSIAHTTIPCQYLYVCLASTVIWFDPEFQERTEIWIQVLLPLAWYSNNYNILSLQHSTAINLEICSGFHWWCLWYLPMIRPVCSFSF